MKHRRERREITTVFKFKRSENWPMISRVQICNCSYTRTDLSYIIDFYSQVILNPTVQLILSVNFFMYRHYIGIEIPRMQNTQLYLGYNKFIIN